MRVKRKWDFASKMFKQQQPWELHRDQDFLLDLDQGWVQPPLSVDWLRCESKSCHFSCPCSPWTANKRKRQSRILWRRRKCKASRSADERTFRRCREREWVSRRTHQTPGKAWREISNAKTKTKAGLIINRLLMLLIIIFITLDMPIKSRSVKTR